MNRRQILRWFGLGAAATVAKQTQARDLTQEEADKVKPVVHYVDRSQVFTASYGLSASAGDWVGSGSWPDSQDD